MTKAEWILWITSTLFQGVIAWQVIWEHRTLRRMAKMTRQPSNKVRSVEPEVVS